MKVLFCHIGFMNLYNGPSNDDKPLFGGEYNKTHVGHEVYNFANYNGNYYGFVQNSKSSIEVNRLIDGASKKSEYADNVLVVWCAKKRTGNGVFVVGWYKNATVYRNLQPVPEDVLKQRDDKEKCEFNVFSNEAVLIPTNERNHQVQGIGRYAWYGNDKAIQDVVDYIESYEHQRDSFIHNISENFENISGEEKEAIVKIRINHDKFRNRLLIKYKHTCCLSGCGISEKDLLVASHIKPWKDSDSNEKVVDCNGLLLCVLHDKLFDRGFISFDDNGRILISNHLNKNDIIFLNIDANRRIEITDDNIPFLRYHRKHIFKP